MIQALPLTTAAEAAMASCPYQFRLEIVEFDSCFEQRGQPRGPFTTSTVNFPGFCHLAADTVQQRVQHFITLANLRNQDAARRRGPYKGALRGLVKDHTAADAIRRTSVSAAAVKRDFSLRIFKQ
jgi:hypothetical protein